MARKAPRTVPYRRKREQKTNYGKRIKSLLAGKLRLVVRITGQRIIAQLVSFTPKGDKVELGVDSSCLKKLGWSYSCKNTPAAYLVGLLLSKKAVAAGNKEAILDTGFRLPLAKGKLYAFLRGVIDGGLNVPHDEKVLPEEDQFSGKSIVDYAEKLKEKKELYERQFAQYLKKGAKPEEMVTLFIKIKQDIKK